MKKPAPHPFILDDKHILWLERELREASLTVVFQAACADKSTRTFTTAAKLLDYHNFRSRAVEELKVTAFTPSGDINYLATFVNSRFGKPLDVYVAASPEIQARLISSTEQLFEEIKAWYAKLPDPLLVATVTGSLVAIALGGLKIGSQNTVGLPEPSRRIGDLLDQFGLWADLLFLLFVLLVGRLAYRFWQSIFPMGTFTIGSGRKRHEQLESFRWAVVVGFVVSILAGILLSSYLINTIRSLY